MKIAKIVAGVMVSAGMVASVMAAEVSDITAGGEKMVLKAGANRNIKTPGNSKYEVKTIPAELNELPAIVFPRGDSGKAAEVAYSFKLDKAATVYLFVDAREKNQKVLEGWTKTDLKATWLAWGQPMGDVIYKKDVEAGVVTLPANSKAIVPSLAVIKAK